MKIFKYYPENRSVVHEVLSKRDAVNSAKIYAEQNKCVVYVDSEYGRVGFVSPPYIDPRGNLIKAKYYAS